jgi:hypothetical protein
MHLEELIATLIATVKTNTSSVDENNRLLRSHGASATAVMDAPADAPAKRKTKEKPAPEPEVVPEPEPEAVVTDAEDEEEDDGISGAEYLEKAKAAVQAYRKAFPTKRSENVEKLQDVLVRFGAEAISKADPKHGKDLYHAVMEFSAL